MTEHDPSEVDTTATSSLPVARRTYLTALAAGAAATGEAAAESTDDSVEPSDGADQADRPFNYGWSLTASEAGASRDMGYGDGPYGGGPVPPLETALPPKDIDDDGKYENIRGNAWKPGTPDDAFSILDVQGLFNNLENPDVKNNVSQFNFQSNDNQISILDVQSLFNELQNS
jgi:hypothetical protein